MFLVVKFLSLCFYPIGKHVYYMYLHDVKNEVLINHFLEFKISSCLTWFNFNNTAILIILFSPKFGKNKSVEEDRQQSIINQHLLVPVPGLYLQQSVCDVMSTGEQCLTIAVKIGRLSNVKTYIISYQ